MIKKIFKKDVSDTMWDLLQFVYGKVEVDWMVVNIDPDAREKVRQDWEQVKLDNKVRL